MTADGQLYHALTDKQREIDDLRAAQTAPTLLAPLPRPPATALPPPAFTASSAYERAREAALRGEPAIVRQLLEMRVRAGHGTREEAALVRQSCKLMGDRACVEDVKAKYPEV